MIIHTVTQGETYSDIARTYGITVSGLLKSNGLTAGEFPVTGQALVILFPEIIHRVSAGETLFQIAEKYDVTVNRLLRNNYYLMGNTEIYPGQEIVVRYRDEPEESTRINAYAYTYIDYSLLRSTLPYLTYLSPFTYGITEAGNLIGINDEPMINLAKSYGVQPLMHISTLNEQGVFSNETAANVFRNENVRDNLIYRTELNLKTKGYHGLDIDFEFINPSESVDYANLIKQFTNALNPMGYEVFAALAPKTSDEQKGTLYEGHNYGLIGSAADYVLLMTYEWGYTYGPPMAVAPINKVREVLSYAVTRIPPDKIYLGVPTYGYDFTLPYIKGVSRAPSISNETAIKLAREYGAEIQFDETAMAPWFRYTDSTGKIHEVWFEDARSIRAKLMLISEFGFAGAGYWDLLRPFPQNWTVLNALFRVENI